MWFISRLHSLVMSQDEIVLEILACTRDEYTFAVLKLFYKEIAMEWNGMAVLAQQSARHQMYQNICNMYAFWWFDDSVSSHLGHCTNWLNYSLPTKDSFTIEQDIVQQNNKSKDIISHPRILKILTLSPVSYLKLTLPSQSPPIPILSHINTSHISMVAILPKQRVHLFMYFRKKFYHHMSTLSCKVSNSLSSCVIYIVNISQLFCPRYRIECLTNLIV